MLRDFGMGRTLMEAKIQREVDALTEYFDRQINNENCDNGWLLTEVTKPIAICVANIINDIIFGRTFAYVCQFVFLYFLNCMSKPCFPFKMG